MRIVCQPDGLPIDYTVQLANALSKKAEVMIILFNNPQLEDHIGNIDKNVNIFLSEKVRYPLYHPKNLLIIIDLLKKIRQFKPDILHIQSGDLLSMIIWYSIGRCTLITTIHDVHFHPGAERFSNRLVRFWSLKNSKKIFVHGKKLKEMMIREYNLPEDNVHTIPIGEHNIAPCKKYIDENINEGKFILFFGWIGIRKGLEYLIKAEPLISNEIPDVKIVIAGRMAGGKLNRDYFKKCQDLIINKQNFEIYNQYISWEFCAELYQKSSLVVLPYIEISQSGVIPTAYGFKKPVVVTDVGAMPEIVDDGITGFIVPPKNPYKLAEAIIKILKDEELRKRMGENAYKKLMTDLSWNNIAKRTIHVYNDAINDK